MALLSGVQHVGLCVTDIERSLAFYTEVLGLTLTERHEPGEGPLGSMGGAFMRCRQYHHDVVLFFNVPDHGERAWFGVGRTPSPPSAHIAFMVDDRAALEAMLDRVRAAGIAIVHGPVKHSSTHPDGDGTYGENRAFYFQDPDGHVIEIMCEMALVDA